METISLKLDTKFLHDIEAFMKKHRYITKTEFIRDAIREKLSDLEKEEMLKQIEKLFGSSKHKTSDEDLHKAGEKAFKELEKKFKIK